MEEALRRVPSTIQSRLHYSLLESVNQVEGFINRPDDEMEAAAIASVEKLLAHVKEFARKWREMDQENREGMVFLFEVEAIEA